MGLILAIIGAIAGWKAGDLRWSYFALIAVVAVIPAGLNMTILWPRLDTLMVVSAWITAFVFLAVPFVACAWLKRMRLCNREGE